MSTQNIVESYIGQGTLTNSKHPARFVKGVYPTHVTKGYGCHLWDETGNRYIDYICGLGTNLVGYARREVVAAVKDQLEKGSLYSLSAAVEAEFGREIVERFGFIQKIKVVKTGTEGCMAAVKMALAHTKKTQVVTEGYHGWSNLLIAHQPPAAGIPTEIKKCVHLASDNFDWDKIGAYIVEPVITDWSKERVAYLHALREKCTKHNVVLIFDETITALRFPKGSVAQEIGCDPDMIVMGKALGSGLPISIVGGSSDIMDNPDYFVSGTFSGDLLAIAAARTTLKICDQNALTELWSAGEQFTQKFNEVCRGVVSLEGYPTRGSLVGSEENKALFMEAACNSFVLFGPSWFFNLSHPAETSNVIGLCEEICTKIRNKEIRRTGELPTPAFGQTTRENNGKKETNNSGLLGDGKRKKGRTGQSKNQKSKEVTTPPATAS
jgi:glutamate-1-semialdehyde 2,1-aminomutase